MSKCGFCSTILSFKNGSTQNLLRHLKSKHPVVTDKHIKLNHSIANNNDNWNLMEKVCAIVNDHAANIRNAIRLGNWNHITK